MKFTGTTPDRIKKIHIQGSQDSSTFHFDDTQGVPKEGLWLHVHREKDGPSKQCETPPADRGTAVSFSPPNQRVHPRQQNEQGNSKKKNAGKRKESAVSLSDEDDDFVRTPPRVAKATKAAAAGKSKRAKSSHGGPKPSEGANNPSTRKSLNYRCAPNKIIEAIGCLTDDQKKKIRELGFGALLDLKITGLESTKLLVFLMDNLDPTTLNLNIGSGKCLKITCHSIQVVLGLMNRGTPIVVPDKHRQREALAKLKQQLGFPPAAHIKFQDLINWIKKKRTDDLSVRCFILILFSKLLMPGTSDYISGKEAALTEDLSTLCCVNWAKFIYDDIALSAELWHSRNNVATSPSMYGCVMFPLVYYLDNLLGHHSTYLDVVPRITYFTKQKLLDLIEEDKKVVNGVVTFGALPLRSQEGTCYMEVSSPSFDAPSVPSANIHRVPSANIPSMRENLAGCFDGLPAEKQLAVMEALRRCDDDVARLMVQIRASQDAAVQEIRNILGHSHHYTSPTPVNEGAGNPASTPSPLPNDKDDNHGTAQAPMPADQTDGNLQASGQHPCPAYSNDAYLPNVLNNDGRHTEEETGITNDISFTQIIEGDGFGRLSTAQQEAVTEELYGNPDKSQS